MVTNRAEATADGVQENGGMVVGNRLLFGTSVESGNPGLWLSDGTAAGTVRLSHQSPTTWPSFTGNSTFVQLGRHVYFISPDESGDGRLWRTDLTSQGTIQVSRLVLRNTTNLGDLAVAGGRVYFFGQGVDGEELWSTDGTAAGTQSLVAFGQPARPNPILFADQNGILLFSVRLNGETQLWRSDGTSEGTYVIHESYQGYTVENSLIQAQDYTYFSDIQGLWRTDGTRSGTVLTHPRASTGSVQPTFAAADGSLLYRMSEFVDNNRQSTLWRIAPGAATGDRLLVAAAGAETISRFMSVGDRTGFFIQYKNRTELWTTNGTSESTRLVRSVPAVHRSIRLQSAIIGDDTFFTGYTIGTGLEIWKTDGTVDGTHVIEMQIGDTSMRPESLTNLNDHLFFTGVNGTTGREWWSMPLSPELTAISGGVVYRENNPPVLLAAGALLSDADSANFNRGTLQVSYGAPYGQSGDQLTVATTGFGASRVRVIDGHVKYGTYTIGRVSGGVGGTALTIRLNANATVERVQALIRSISFHTFDDVVVNSRRDLSFTLFEERGESRAARVSVTLRPL